MILSEKELGYYPHYLFRIWWS